jgi:transposase
VITIGVDPHKHLHVALAVNESGHEAAEWQGPNTPDGWTKLIGWSHSLGTERQWGIEGAWSYGRGLAQKLVASGEVVFDINPRWTAERRRGARNTSKTDKRDAKAIASVVREEGRNLPRVLSADETGVLDLLTSERVAAVVEATRLRNQIHAHLMRIDSEYQAHMPSLKSRAGVNALLDYSSPVRTDLEEQRALVVRRLAQRLQLALLQADELEVQINGIVEARYLPLTKLCGVSLITAGTLAAILGPGNRFKSDAQLAAYAGVAPLETSSAGLVRHRLNRGGNRRLNAALYRIVLTQAHHLPEARVYLARRVSQGKTRREAHRALRRFVVRAIWRLWQECHPREMTTENLAA